MCFLTIVAVVVLTLNSSSAGLSSPRTPEEMERLKAGAQQYVREIIDVLAKVPPPLLLLLKTLYVS